MESIPTTPLLNQQNQRDRFQLNDPRIQVHQPSNLAVRTNQRSPQSLKPKPVLPQIHSQFFHLGPSEADQSKIRQQITQLENQQREIQRQQQISQPTIQQLLVSQLKPLDQQPLQNQPQANRDELLRVLNNSPQLQTQLQQQQTQQSQEIQLQNQIKQLQQQIENQRASQQFLEQYLKNLEQQHQSQQSRQHSSFQGQIEQLQQTLAQQQQQQTLIKKQIPEQVRNLANQHILESSQKLKEQLNNPQPKSFDGQISRQLQLEQATSQSLNTNNDRFVSDPVLSTLQQTKPKNIGQPQVSLPQLVSI